MRYNYIPLMVALSLVLSACAGMMEELFPKAEPGRSPEEVMIAAQAGDAQAAFWAYQQADTKAQRRMWVCIAANRDFPEAQAEIARLHWRGAGIFSSPFERDVFVAYVWSVIAMGRGEDLGRNEERLTQIMDEGERQQAIQLAEAWQPDPSQCENMEESGYFRVPSGNGA